MATKQKFSLCFGFIIGIYFCYGTDTISRNQFISGDDVILSSGGTFVLGFFSPGTSKYYIGMWFKKERERTVVWVANRETPISNKYTSKLQIVGGNLVLLDESHVTVWSTDTNISSTNIIAVLLDEGNLVLKDYGSNSKLWQSFDNPTDTWLPGTKLAYNNRTKTSQRLISWKNSEDPAPGLYSYELDPYNNRYVILLNRSVQIWTSGSWNNETQTFALLPMMTVSKDYNFKWSYVSNINESYLIYSLYNSSLFKTRLIMDHTGQIKQYSLTDFLKWSLLFCEPETQCNVNAYCGAYGACNSNSFPFCKCLPGFKSRYEKNWNLRDYSGGCVRNIELECGNTNITNRKDYKFRKFSDMKLPYNPQIVLVESVGSCKSMCLSNCSCTAYAYQDNGCFTWSAPLFNMQQLSQDDINAKVIYIKLDSSEFSKSNKGIVYGAVGGSIAVVIITVSGLIIFILIRKMKMKRRLAETAARAVEGTLVAFGFKDLQSATDNFAVKLGKGGFGSVFKGTLPDSTVIAVKKLDGINQGEKQFRSEVSTLGNIQHVNLVHLRGLCSQGEKRLLVYEYMSNRSLDSHIFNSENILSWKTRYEIALGTAKGLDYLHEKCRDCIIHCDVKPENILLDADMCPKVADFGLAKLMGRDFSRVITTMRGTRGYLAPEWIAGVAVTSKADVFSYGMMLFEVVSGRRNLEKIADGTASFFPVRAATARVTIDGGDILSLLDPKLNRNANIEQVTNLCRVACWCIQDAEIVRPSMGQIVQILEGVLDVNLPPELRRLSVFTDEHGNMADFTDESSFHSLQIKGNPSWTSSPSRSGTSAEISNV